MLSWPKPVIHCLREFLCKSETKSQMVCTAIKILLLASVGSLQSPLLTLPQMHLCMLDVVTIAAFPCHHPTLPSSYWVLPHGQVHSELLMKL